MLTFLDGTEASPRVIVRRCRRVRHPVRARRRDVRVPASVVVAVTGHPPLGPPVRWSSFHTIQRRVLRDISQDRALTVNHGGTPVSISSSIIHRGTH